MRGKPVIPALPAPLTDCANLFWSEAVWKDVADPPRFQLRPAQPSDEEFLKQLGTERFASQFDGAAIGPDLLAQLLMLQVTAQAASYAAAWPHAFHAVVLDNIGQPAGRLMVSREPDCLRLVDIVLHSRVRGRGIGTALIRALQSAGTDDSLPVRLCAMRTNRAVGLYSRLGFRVVGEDDVYLEMEWVP